jgi:hypothetical protein
MFLTGNFVSSCIYVKILYQLVILENDYETMDLVKYVEVVLVYFKVTGGTGVNTKFYL